MRTALTTAASESPISLADARAWIAAQTGVTSDDPLITELIDEVTAYLEQRLCGRKLVTQTWTVWLDASEVDDVIRLPLLPLQSVGSVKTYDDDGAETTVATTNYHVRIGENPKVALTTSGTWPSDLRPWDAMAIECVVGYGAASALPADLVQLVKGLVMHFYSSKGIGVTQTVSGQLISIPNVYERQIASYRVEPWA